VEKTGISWAAPDRQDEYNFKELLEIRPLFTGQLGQVITITVGFQPQLDAAVTWGTPQTFTIGTDPPNISVNALGRYLAIRFSWSDVTMVTEFQGYFLDIVEVKEGN
jgi:hypothetical protein